MNLITQGLGTNQTIILRGFNKYLGAGMIALLINGVWNNNLIPYILISGSWRSVTEVKVVQDGEWRKVK